MCAVKSTRLSSDHSVTTGPRSARESDYDRSVATLILARHGEADWNREQRWQGQADRPLTPRGRQQARELGRSLAGFTIDAVYASDLVRAYETAKLAVGGRGLPVGSLPALRERGIGPWEGLEDGEIPARFPREYRAFLDGASAGPWGAESFESLVSRVEAAIHWIAVRHGTGTALVVAHSGPLAVIHAAATGVDFLTAQRSIPQAEYCAPSFLTAEGHRWELVDSRPSGAASSSRSGTGS